MANVLVVEDTPDTRVMLMKLLELSGHVAAAAKNGREALEAVHDVQPDLILLDVMMPVMNGIEFLERLREDPQQAGVPVVLFTGLTDAPQLDEAIRLGVSKVFRKADFTWEDVLTAIVKHAPTA